MGVKKGEKNPNYPKNRKSRYYASDYNESLKVKNKFSVPETQEFIDLMYQSCKEYGDAHFQSQRDGYKRTLGQYVLGLDSGFDVSQIDGSYLVDFYFNAPGRREYTNPVAKDLIYHYLTLNKKYRWHPELDIISDNTFPFWNDIQNMGHLVIPMLDGSKDPHRCRLLKAKTIMKSGNQVLSLFSFDNASAYSEQVKMYVLDGILKKDTKIRVLQNKTVNIMRFLKVFEDEGYKRFSRVPKTAFKRLFESLEDSCSYNTICAYKGFLLMFSDFYERNFEELTDKSIRKFLQDRNTAKLNDIKHANKTPEVPIEYFPVFLDAVKEIMRNESEDPEDRITAASIVLYSQIGFRTAELFTVKTGSISSVYSPDKEKPLFYMDFISFKHGTGENGGTIAHTYINSLSKEAYELQKSIYEEKCAKHEMTKQTWDNISAGVGLVSDALVFLSENPEVAVSLVKHGKKVINTISNAAGKAKNGIKTVFSRKKKTKEKQLVNDLGETSASQFGVLASDSQSAVYNEIIDDKDSIEREEMSIEEARTLVISILAEYISMKRNINRLSKAKIYESNMPQLDMKQVLIYMDIIIEQYPALMDEQTSCSILDILHSNSNLAENKKILEVLKIETDTEMYAYEDTIVG